MPREFLSYISSFFAFAGRSVWIVFALVFIGVLLDSVGLLMLVPFLQLFIGTDPSEFTLTLMQVLSSFGIATPKGQLLTAMGAFLSLLLIRNVIGWHRDTMIMRLTQGFVDHWRERIFSAIANATWTQVMAHRRTDLEHAIMTDVSRLSNGTDRVLRGAVIIAMMMIQIIVALYLSPALTLIVLAFMMLAGFLLMPLVKRARVLGDFTTKSGRGVHNLLGEFMAGLKLSKALDAGDGYVSRFTDKLEIVRDHLIRFRSDQALAKAVFQITSGIIVCLVIIVGLFYLKTPVPTLIVILIIMTRLTGPFLTLAQSVQSMANMIPAFQSLQRIELEMGATEIIAPKATKEICEESLTTPAHIKLQNVAFSYNAQSAPVIAGVSFTLEPGEFTLLVGKSGAGKTTLADIVSGLLQPTVGQLVLDGELVDTSGPSNQWRRGLAYVPQETLLFDISVRENLVWPAAVEVTDEAIWGALEFAQAANFVRETLGGLDARVGERGQSFSGGERQRLSLARAMLRNPRLIILDEATNSIDNELEIEVLNRLGALRGEISILVITHRPESFKNVDRILEVRDGGVFDVAGDTTPSI